LCRSAVLTSCPCVARQRESSTPGSVPRRRSISTAPPQEFLRSLRVCAEWSCLLVQLVVLVGRPARDARPRALGVGTLPLGARTRLVPGFLLRSETTVVPIILFLTVYRNMNIYIQAHRRGICRLLHSRTCSQRTGQLVLVILAPGSCVGESERQCVRLCVCVCVCVCVNLCVCVYTSLAPAHTRIHKRTHKHCSRPTGSIYSSSLPPSSLWRSIVRCVRESARERERASERERGRERERERDTRTHAHARTPTPTRTHTNARTHSEGRKKCIRDTHTHKHTQTHTHTHTYVHMH